MWPVTYALPDGSRINVTDSELVPVGDVMMHKQLTYRRPGSAESPGLEIVFEIRGGEPMCVRIELVTEGESPIRPIHFTSLKIDNLRDDVYGYIGVYRPNPDGGWVHERGSESSFLRDRRTVNDAASDRRKKMDGEFLQKVADVHNEAPPRTKIRSVMHEFVVSQRQAKRYIEAAREKGLIR